VEVCGSPATGREGHDDEVAGTKRSSGAEQICRTRSARLVDQLVGQEPLRRLVIAYMTAAGADALVTVSLAGSLFFSVSNDAARSRVLVYLLLTLAPFAVVGPFVGPAIDRLPGGQRLLLAFTCAGRVVAALLIARHLTTLFLFPEAFAVLVLGKSASEAKSVLVPWLVGDERQLVSANARISRMTTVSGGIMFSIGAGVLTTFGSTAVLVLAAAIYVLATVLVLRIPRPSIPAADPVVEEVELRGDVLRLAANAQSILRASVGFLAFLLAFNLKAEGQPPWVYGVVIAASGAGGFAGTFVAVLGRRWLREEAMLTAGLAVPGALALLGSIQYRRSSAVLAAVAVGNASNAGHHAFTSNTKPHAPDAEKGRAFAHFETQFQLSWVVGALIPVLVKLASPIGLAGMGTGLVVGAVFFGTASRTARHQELVVRTRLEPPGGQVPVSMLTLARALHGQGASRLAVLTAMGAARAAAAAAQSAEVAAGEPCMGATTAPPTPRPLDRPAVSVLREPAAQPALDLLTEPDGRLFELWRRAASGGTDLSDLEVDEALDLAGEVVDALLVRLVRPEEPRRLDGMARPKRPDALPATSAPGSMAAPDEPPMPS
jgi:hypothetical protein